MDSNLVTITVRPVGSARQAYEVEISGGSRNGTRFQIRTTSPRRYLVVSLSGKYVLLRTNNAATAAARKRQNGHDRIVIDRRIIDAPAAAMIDTRLPAGVTEPGEGRIYR